jgi:hypothetical protein
MKQYFKNLWLWSHVWWLWTRRLHATIGGVEMEQGIVYKPGWGPWKFLPIYLTTYLAGCLCGYGVVSLSRAWYDRSRMCISPGCNEDFHKTQRQYKFIPKYPFARFMTRALNWAFPGSRHGRETGPRLWGSVNLRD